MRNYLKDVNIVGGFTCWSEGEIIRYAIESLLEHCNVVFITCDYSDDKTKKIVEEYRNKNSDRIFVGDTSARLPSTEGMNLAKIWERAKKFCGQLIESNFDMVKEYHKKHPVDILIFLDSDEMFTVNIQNVLERFWASKVDTVFIKPIEVYSDIHIIANKGLVSHAKIYKFKEDITAIPYSQQNFYLPYRRNRNIWKESWNFVHLARLTEINRKLRGELRQKPHGNMMAKLRRVSKPAYELTPAEAEIVDTSEKFIRIKDWNGDINSVPLIL